MDEILMREYLRSKGRGMSDEAFMRKIKEHFNEFPRSRRDSRYEDFYEEDIYDNYSRNNMRRHNSESDFMDMSAEEKKRFAEMLLEGENAKHFNDSYAKYVVSKMYHTEGGRKYVGEKFDMMKAKEVCERYRGIIPASATQGDVYVAINAQYHDYCELFKAWFGDNVDIKIIESAINFWFKDDDFKEGCKVWKYFNM